MSELKTRDVFQVIEALAPKHFAYDWDNVGLQVGSYDAPVKRVMVALDTLENVVDEAIEKEVDLIIAHHPLIFKPLKSVNVNDIKGKIIEKLIKHDITVYAAHTNLDIAEGGVNDMLAEALNIENTEALLPVSEQKLLKLAVFVPESHLNQVRDAISEAGAGHIGDYSHCTFQTEGQGTFKPLAGTNPYSGEIGEIAYEAEVKLETIVPDDRLSTVIDAMISAHPYEEVAYDLFPLENKGKKYGLGRIGNLPNKTTLESFIEYIKATFSLDHLRYVGDLEKPIKKVAVLGGSGEKYIHQAKARGADVYVTGDLTFHLAQEAEAIGLSVIDPGHYIEVLMKEQLATYLQNKLPKYIDVTVSNSHTESIRFL